MTIDPNNRKRRATRGYVHTHAGINPGYSALQQSYDEHGNPIDPNQPNPCNLHEVEVHADGNCLFRSVSDQMYLSEEYHELIRTKTMEYVKVEKDFFRDYIPNENFEAYVARKAKLGEWGDDLEIQALSEIYDCAVEIYDSEGRLQKTFHEFHGNGFQQHQPTGEMNDLMDSEYSWLEGVPIPQPVAGGGGSSSSSSRGPQHSDLRADLSGHLAPHMMSQHVPRSVIRLVYRGQSHYNSLRDMNRSRNLPQILQVREKFLRKLGYPQHAVPRNLPGAIEDLAIEYRRRNKNLNMEAAQQHRMEMEKRGGASLVGGSNNVQGAMKGEGLLSPRSGGAAGVHLAGGHRNPAAAAAEEQERRAMAESLALMQKQQDDDLNKAISMSLGGAINGLTSRGPTPSIGIGIGGGGGGTATSAPSDKTTPTLGPQQVGVESAASATSEEDQLLQEALLLSMQKDGGEAARSGAPEQAAEPQPRPPPEQAGYPDAVLQCVSFGVPLEKALKAYEFAGADLDDMMLFLTTLS